MATSPADAKVQPSAFGCITIPFLLLALVPLVWGARSNWSNGQLLRSGEATTGHVVELRHVPTNPSIRLGKGGSNSAVVTFRGRGGEERTMVSSVNRYPSPWQVGEAVEVVYDPADLERVDLRSELEVWRRWFGIWCAVALLPGAIAFAPLVLAIRRRRRR